MVLESLAAGTPVVTTARAGAASAIAGEGVGSVLGDPGDVGALEDAVGSWLERIRAGSVDRELVRGAVDGRDREAWLEELADVVTELAR